MHARLAPSTVPTLAPSEADRLRSSRSFLSCSRFRWPLQIVAFSCSAPTRNPFCASGRKLASDTFGAVDLGFCSLAAAHGFKTSYISNLCPPPTPHPKETLTVHCHLFFTRAPTPNPFSFFVRVRVCACARVRVCLRARVFRRRCSQHAHAHAQFLKMSPALVWRITFLIQCGTER